MPCWFPSPVHHLHPGEVAGLTLMLCEASCQLWIFGEVLTQVTTTGPWWRVEVMEVSNTPEKWRLWERTRVPIVQQFGPYFPRGGIWCNSCKGKFEGYSLRIVRWSSWLFDRYKHASPLKNGGKGTRSFPLGVSKAHSQGPRWIVSGWRVG